MTKEELIKKGNDEEAINAYIEITGSDEYLDNFEESYQGKHSSDRDFVQQLLEDTGDLPKLPFYIHIDWESTARDVMMDYSEENGYYFRNL